MSFKLLIFKSRFQKNDSKILFESFKKNYQYVQEIYNEDCNQMMICFFVKLIASGRIFNSNRIFDSSLDDSDLIFEFEKSN